MYRLFLILVVLLAALPAAAADMAPRIRVAVLPFETPRDRPGFSQYGVGTMDSLIAGLRSVPQFVMVDRGRIEPILREQGFYQTGLVDARAAARLGEILGVQTLITGSIQSAGEQIRIVANFVDVRTAEIRDTQQVTGELTSIFNLQDQLATLFIKSQNVAITPEQQQRLQKAMNPTTSLTAYDYYLKGRQAFVHFTPEGYAEAIGLYQKAIAVDRRYALAYAGLGQVWAKWGITKEMNGEPARREYEQAEEFSLRALAINPDLPEAHRSAGTAYAFLGKPGAERELRRAAELNPNDGETWMYLWWFIARAEDPDHEYIRRALELDPQLASARTGRGLALFQRGRHEEAIAELREVVRVQPTFHKALAGLGRALAGLKRYDEAIGELRAAIRAMPQMADYHYYLARALDDRGRQAEAVAAYQEALRIHPRHADARYYLGFVYWQQGKWREVIREWEEVLRIDPQHAGAKEWLPKARAKLNG